MSVDRRTALGVLAGAVGSLTLPRSARASDTPHPARPDAVGLLFDTTKCAGCRACVRACRDQAGLAADDRTAGYELYDAPTDLNDRTRTIIKLASTDMGTTFVKQQCMHCLDPSCAAACMLGSLEKTEFGAVTWDPEFCIGCRYCQVACPFNVPKFEWESATPRIVKCDLCQDRLADGELPACCDACPRDAVICGPRAEMVAEAHRRLEADPDRYVPTVYGEDETGGTQILMLSAVPFEELGLPELGDRPTHALQRTLQHGVYKGFVAPTVLYGILGAVLFKNRKSLEGYHADSDAMEETGESVDA